jgi:hypothetical protein
MVLEVVKKAYPYYCDSAAEEPGSTKKKRLTREGSSCNDNENGLLSLVFTIKISSRLI